MDGDELVIQFWDDGKFRLFPEKKFEQKIQKLLFRFEKIEEENVFEKRLKNMFTLTNLPQDDILKNEFVNLSSQSILERKTIFQSKTKLRERNTACYKKIIIEYL